jgi:micrococcal nuclease
MERISAWFGGLTTGTKALVVISLVLFAALSPPIGPLAMLFFIVCIPVVAYMKFGRRRYRRPSALLGHVLAVALLTSVASSGLYCAPAEQSDSPSSTRNGPKEVKSKGTAGDDAQSTRPKTEAAKSTAVERAEQPAAKPEPKPEPKPKPKPEPAKKQEPKSKRSTSDPPSPYDATVTVARVVDGDTVDISPAIMGTEDVRLIGMDTPETVDPGEGVEPYGPQASAFAKRELTGRKVGLAFDVEKIDQYGRLLAYVYTNGSMFNEELVEKGYAQAYPYPPNTTHESKFAAAQSRARASGIGIWALTKSQQCELEDRGNGIGEGTRGCAATASSSASASPGSAASAGSSVNTGPRSGDVVAPISEDDCPTSAPVKGNQSGLYHVPGGAYYDVTNPEECFATPADAEAAGYETSSR